ncbi:MAG: XdhC family protein [Gammaproteobacteria bacterium]|nr:XdhC family protein [Gammaproteobacteria bacterium]
MRRSLLTEILEARTAGRAMAVITQLQPLEHALYFADDTPTANKLAAQYQSEAEQALRSDRNVLIESDQGNVFIQAYNPPLRVIIVGAVHIAQFTAPIATQLNYEVTVVDARRAFANAQRFPNVHVVNEWPDRALPKLKLDHRTAVVALTHDPKLDDPALTGALRSNAFYIGALGSRKTHAARIERLRKHGFDDAELRRIRGPIGLDIGAASPGEIAVSIMAEITRTLRRPKLREPSA